MEKVFGTKVFGERIDVTDPCYDRDVWCRKNDIEIRPGEYECYADVLSNDETCGFGKRVSRIGIRHIGTNERCFECIGVIGVDAGLAGFFQNKPDYDDDEWADFCGRIEHGNLCYFSEEGFFSSSGYGDGEYGVYAAYSEQQIVALEIHFITEDDDSDGEEDDCDLDDE